VVRDYNFWVYIMTNEHDTALYIGMTNDLAKRVSEHRAGEMAGFTANYRCKKLIYYEHCAHVRDAIAREKQLKKWSRSKKVALMLNPHWLDLAPAVLGEEQEMPTVPAGKLFADHDKRERRSCHSERSRGISNFSEDI
jgi:putative endonuclease